MKNPSYTPSFFTNSPVNPQTKQALLSCFCRPPRTFVVVADPRTAVRLGALEEPQGSNDVDFWWVSKILLWKWRTLPINKINPVCLICSWFICFSLRTYNHIVLFHRLVQGFFLTSYIPFGKGFSQLPHRCLEVDANLQAVFCLRPRDWSLNQSKPISLNRPDVWWFDKRRRREVAPFHRIKTFVECWDLLWGLLVYASSYSCDPMSAFGLGSPSLSLKKNPVCKGRSRPQAFLVRMVLLRIIGVLCLLWFRSQKVVSKHSCFLLPEKRATVATYGACSQKKKKNRFENHLPNHLL